MKVEDLMICDWVHSKLHNVDTKIECVGDEPGLETRFQCVWLTSKECWERHYLNEIEPIPLTAEILEKNGFVNDDDTHYGFCGTDNTIELLAVETSFGIDSFDIVRTQKGINNNGQKYYLDYYFATIHYVHQLQHALRLCGIDKEIIL